jgi:hypothetical protein
MGGTEALKEELNIDVPTFWLGLARRDRSCDVPAAMIRLNAETCLKNTTCCDGAKRETFGALLHEMIHGRFSLHISYQYWDLS